MVGDLHEYKGSMDDTVLEKANIRSCFPIVDKEVALTDDWRRVIVRKVRKSMWEGLDEFDESVLDIILQKRGKRYYRWMGHVVSSSNHC